MSPDPGVGDSEIGTRPFRRARRRLLGVAVLVAVVAGVTGCGGGGSSPKVQGQQEAYLDQVSGSAPGISSYRSDSQLIRLGQAVCDDFKAGVSYETIADRLSTTTGADRLPAADLGAVITSAATNLCPQFESKLT